MIFEKDIFGNNQLLDLIHGFCNSNDFPNSMIISGPKGSGKSLLADYISMCLGCSSMCKPCCSCDNCMRISEHICPDIIYLNLSDDKKTIGVPEIRKIKEDAYIATDVLDVKVYIINDADCMTVQAQNALLKLFEEPPKNVYFILNCISASNLLPTVRSRTVEFRTQLFTNDELIRFAETYCKEKNISNVSDDKINKAVKISEGTIGNLLKFLNDGFDDEFCQVAEKIITQIEQHDYSSMIGAFAPYLQKRDEMSLIIYSLLLATRDITSCKKTKGEISTVFFVDRDKAKHLSASFSIKYLSLLYECLIKAYNDLSDLNTNIKTTVYSLVAEIRGISI